MTEKNSQSEKAAVGIGRSARYVADEAEIPKRVEVPATEESRSRAYTEQSRLDSRERPIPIQLTNAMFDNAALVRQPTMERHSAAPNQGAGKGNQ